MNDLDKLKDLLFGAEKQALDSIAERVGKPETRATDIADVLPESIHQSYQRGPDLVAALTEPVGECLQEAIHNDPQSYSDVLYPVMGPAIRKSIAHTLRALSQQINQAFEQSLTPRGLKWRMQASRAGIPYGEFIMQKTLLYRVEQTYLISRENGLLIEHVHHAASKIKDSDAVSAMFTAIQDFVKESFSPDRTGRLESADMGEFTLWAVHGPHALLVCVIRGVPPRTLRGDLSAILERIHFRYGDALRTYAGDTASIPGVDGELQKCLGFQATQEKEKGNRGTNWPLIIIGLLLTSLVAYLLFQRWSEAREIERIGSVLRETPGIYLDEVLRDDDQILIRGMRDPLATPVADVVAQIDIDPEQLVVNMNAYQSLEPELVERRVGQLLGEIENIAYTVSDGIVTITGTATPAWIEATRIRTLAVAGVDAVDLEDVTDSTLQDIADETARLDGSRFLFANLTTFAPGHAARLRDFSRQLAALQIKAEKSKHTLQVTLGGSTDTAGDRENNSILARGRADAAAAIMSEYGIAATNFKWLQESGASDSQVVDADSRSVVVELTLVPVAD